MCKLQIMIAATLMILYQAAALANAASFSTTSSRTTVVPSDYKPRQQHQQPLFSSTEDDKSVVSSFSFRHLENETDTDHLEGDHDEEDHHEDHHDDHADEDHDDTSKPWGLVIGFTLLVNLATLTGVLFLIPMLSRKARAWVKSVFSNEALPETPEKKENVGSSTFLNIAIPSFASGALLAMAVFLVIPEALYLIQSFLNESGEEHDDHDEDAHRRFLEEEEGHGEEHDEHAGELTPAAIWRFGASLLGGFMLPMLFDLLLPRNRVERSKVHFDGDDCEEERFQEDAETGTRTAAVGAPVKPTSSIKWGLVLSILCGDAFCNFADGVFIGAALSLCDMTTALVIIGVTLYHEIGQELADYFLLTQHAGLTPFKALLLNFASGLTVVLGGLVVLAASVSNMAIGVILSIASGVYLHIACCECLPRVSAVVTTSKERLLSMVIFVVGAVPIALTLLNHSHCEVEAHE